MSRPFSSLEPNLLTAALSALITLVLALALLPFAFHGWVEIPLGILAGGLLASLVYLLLGLTGKKDEENGKPTWAIVLTIVRFVLILIVALLDAFLYYRTSFRYVNPYALIGAYLLPLPVYAIVTTRKNRKQ